MNRLVGQKVAIVSDKPQTTRNRILAVVNRPGAQIVLFDTPGIHKPDARDEPAHGGDGHSEHRPGRPRAVARGGDRAARARATASSSGLLAEVGPPVILALNKIDRVPKPQILPAIEAWRQLADFAEIVPVSALKGDNVDRLEEVLLGRLPGGRAALPRRLPDRPARALLRGRDGPRADPPPHAARRSPT